MYVRLAFAVAAHLEPEILIVDEVLAVGDAEFQKKCLGKMGEVSRKAGGRCCLSVTTWRRVLRPTPNWRFSFIISNARFPRASVRRWDSPVRPKGLFQDSGTVAGRAIHIVLALPWQWRHPVCKYESLHSAEIMAGKPTNVFRSPIKRRPRANSVYPHCRNLYPNSDGPRPFALPGRASQHDRFIAVLGEAFARER